MLITFLKKLWMHLIKCFHKNQIEIPHNIDGNETIIRTIFHPLFFSTKKGVKYNAFLPNGRSEDLEQRKRVSVYRKDYSSDSACKNSAIAIKMKQQTYTGFVAFIAIHLLEINQMPDIKVEAEMLFSPINENNDYAVITNKKIYISGPGIPMHAEILYNKEIDPDEPNTAHRLYADKLVEITKNSVFIDKNPSEANWSQEEIRWKPIN